MPALEEASRYFSAGDTEMRRDVGKDRSQGADAELAVIRDGDMVLAALLGREAQVASGFTRHCVAVLTECPREFEPGERAGAASGGDDLIAHQVQPDHFGPVSLIEVASYRITDGVAQGSEIVGFRDDRRLNTARDIAALGCLFDDEQDLGHLGSSLRTDRHVLAFWFYEVYEQMTSLGAPLIAATRPGSQASRARSSSI